MRIVVTQTVKIIDTQDVEVKANLSYIPVFCQISTESNIAYGEMANQDSCNGLYESIAPPSEDSTTQLPHKEQNEQSYDIID